MQAIVRDGRNVIGLQYFTVHNACTVQTVFTLKATGPGARSASVVNATTFSIVRSEQ